MLTLSITISVPSNITINRLMCIEKERGGGGWEGEGRGGRERGTICICGNSDDNSREATFMWCLLCGRYYPKYLKYII